MIVAIDLENKKNMLLLFDCTEKKISDEIKH